MLTICQVEGHAAFVMRSTSSSRPAAAAMLSTNALRTRRIAEFERQPRNRHRIFRQNRKRHAPAPCGESSPINAYSDRLQAETRRGEAPELVVPRRKPYTYVPRPRRYAWHRRYRHVQNTGGKFARIFQRVAVEDKREPADQRPSARPGTSVEGHSQRETANRWQGSRPRHARLIGTVAAWWSSTVREGEGSPFIGASFFEEQITGQPSRCNVIASFQPSSPAQTEGRCSIAKAQRQRFCSKRAERVRCSPSAAGATPATAATARRFPRRGVTHSECRSNAVRYSARPVLRRYGSVAVQQVGSNVFRMRQRNSTM